MQGGDVRVDDMPDPIVAPDLLATPGTDEALTLADSLWRWLIDSGVKIVVILIAATVIMVALNWLLRRFFRTMVESSSRLSNVTGAVGKRDPRTLQLAQQRRQQRAETLSNAARNRVRVVVWAGALLVILPGVAWELAQQRRQQRAETLSNVARNLVRMVVWAVALVMILSEIGVEIAPVIASLGVIGLAAGIGAQTIIKDFVAGVVMLFEDIVAVGDYVDMEYAEGTVEEINLRATQVRDLNGVLWTVRNGEIIRIGNYSRGFSNAVVVLDIDAEADDDKVTEVLESVTAEMAADPDWSDILQGPANISGMLSMDGNRYQRRVIVRTAPGEQWGVERELRGRFRAGFSRSGLEFAVPRFIDVTTQA